MKRSSNRLKEQLQSVFGHFERFEKGYFYILVILNALPLFLSDFFPTVDGPAHLHNSVLMKALWPQEPGGLMTFFSLNSVILPNLLDHIIMAIGQPLIGGLNTEKIIQVIIIIGLPISIRYLFISNSISNKYLLYFIFPFTYSFLFFFGFYNFLISIIILFFGIGYWESKVGKGLGFALSFGALLIISFFAHLVGFALLIGVIGLFELIKAPQQDTWIKGLRNLSLLLVSALPALTLSLIYLSSKTGSVSLSDELSTLEIFEMIKSVHPARGVEYGKEGVFTQWVLYCLLALLVLGGVQIAKKRLSSPITTLKWGVVSLGILIACFVIPDSGQSSGLVTPRLVFLFYLFLIVFLSSFHVPNWVKAIYVFIGLYVSTSLNLIYARVAEEESKVATAILEASERISPGSTVLPINTEPYWLRGHYSNLLGSNMPMVILENYEAGLSYFPVQWKKPFPKLTLNDEEWANNFAPDVDSSEAYPIEYVFVLGNPKNTGTINIERLEEIYANQEAKVYLYKTKDP